MGGNGVSTTYAGAVTGSVNLVKVGAGMLTLSGSSIGYTGNTTVNAGTLQFYNAVNFSNANAPTNTLAVASGAVPGLLRRSGRGHLDRRNSVPGSRVP